MTDVAHEQFSDIPRVAADIRAMIASAAPIAVVTHARVDADAMASLIAMRSLVERLDGTCILSAAGDSNVQDSLQFLVGELERKDPPGTDTAYDLIIFVDCADITRADPIGAAILEASPNAQTINIDHHVTNTRFADLNLVVPNAAATAEILTVLYDALGLEIDDGMATALLAGVYGDTLGLKTPSTTPHVMRIAADLVEAGAHLDLVVDHLFREKPFSTVKLWGEAQQQAAWRGRLVWTLVDNAMLARSQAKATETEGLVNFLAGTIGAFAAAVIQEASDGWRVSLRSTTEGVDVSRIAKLFEGGGHPRAAGCRLGHGQEAIEAFLETVEHELDRLPAQANARIPSVAK